MYGFVIHAVALTEEVDPTGVVRGVTERTYRAHSFQEWTANMADGLAFGLRLGVDDSLWLADARSWEKSREYRQIHALASEWRCQHRPSWLRRVLVAPFLQRMPAPGDTNREWNQTKNGNDMHMA